MANAVMDKVGEWTEQDKLAAAEHDKKIAENYKRLFSDEALTRDDDRDSEKTYMPNYDDTYFAQRASAAPKTYPAPTYNNSYAAPRAYSTPTYDQSRTAPSQTYTAPRAYSAPTYDQSYSAQRTYSAPTYDHSYTAPSQSYTAPQYVSSEQSYTGDPGSAPSAKERLDSYYAVKSATPRRLLFEGVYYKNGNLNVSENTLRGAFDPNVATAPTMNAAAAPDVAPQGMQMEDDDALPTRRTLDTLKQAGATKTQDKVNISYSLTRKTKIALAVIALLIVVAVAIICINTNIINSLNEDIGTLQMMSGELKAQIAAVQDQIAQIKDPNHIIEWAISQNMIR